MKIEREYLNWSEVRQARADRRINCAMGRMAAEQGWVLSLWEFCREHDRLPEHHEIAALKVKAREFDEALDMCRRGEGGLCSAALVRYGDQLLARREAKARIARGG